MNYLRYFLIFGLLAVGLACKSTADKTGNEQATTAPDGTTLISGTVTSCDADSIRIFKADGITLTPVAAFKVTYENGQGSFSGDFQVKEKGFYYIGPKGQGSKLLILGEDESLTLYGNCSNFQLATVGNSKINSDYATVSRQIDGFTQQFNGLIQQYRKAMKSGQGLENVAQQMVKLDERKLALLDSVQTASPFIAKVVGLRTYLSYQYYQQSGEPQIYSGEPEYFAKNFFTHTDLASPIFNQLPLLHEHFKGYATTLTRIGLSAQVQRDYVIAALDGIPDGSSAEKMAVLGATAGFQGQGVENYIHFGRRYLEDFPKDNPQLRAQVQKQVNAAASRTIGAVAPEITMATPDGNMLNLSDLRGKVVLIDFWASWCGPCRRENPNVVRVYEKYKDKGFEILSVSLDRDKNRWLQAIQKDGLDWLHVSDLKQWKNEAAQLYGVSSIPYTVLLDREGRIIANKLRGAALEAKLAEIFGG